LYFYIAATQQLGRIVIGICAHRDSSLEMANDIKAKRAPALNIPEGETCSVSIINTTCDLTVPENFLTEPKIEGKDWL
jgi:hypothetical protein